jgi:hypothetical protein
MPKFSKSTGYKMKGFTYPGESPLKIASVSGAQLVESVGKTYDKYVNYGKILGEPIAKAFAAPHEKKKMKGEATEELQKVKGDESSRTKSGFTGIPGTEGGEVDPAMMKKLDKPDLSGNFQKGLSGSSSGGFGSATL